MNVYAFDVDETLEVSSGPIPLAALIELGEQGHIVGICGNWRPFVQKVENWHCLVSFLFPLPHGAVKDIFLKQMMETIKADDYVMVGNVAGVSGVSDDKGSAERAGWRFIKESDFAAGAR